MKSPRVTGLSWGKIQVEGYDEPFKDAVLYPGGAEKWDWTRTGTQHSPGIRPADVEYLLERGVEVVVLSKGMAGRLHACPETLELLKNKNVSFYALQTEAAVKVYNDLAETERVGGLFHSTC